MAISFNQVGAFKGVNGGAIVLENPTSMAFGPDGRLYVTEQNGVVNAFSISQQNGTYVATAHEELKLANGGGVVNSIMNHNDDGSNQPFVGGRQVTGMVVTGTAANPVLYVSSSDVRIASSNDSNLDTNSGVISRVTKTGNSWSAVDIIRGLPRSEENHATNGLVLSADGSKLYVSQGGNTNNGAPGSYFAYTGEYALSGTVLEIDLADINSRSILTDGDGGQVGGSATARQYIYDLPTLDDPTVPNNGVREAGNGLDVAGPFGGNDGFNMAILPADAPLRIYADGLRNSYDLVLRQSGQLYTVDNGSNSGFGGDPITVNGVLTSQPNDGGIGDPEPLFLLQDGGYYGHPNPARANQDLPWTVYNNNGNPDGSLSPNSVADLSDLVPNPVSIPNGFLIAPSKFTGNAARLAQSGVRVPRSSGNSNAIVTLGSSSNGLVEYTNGNAFGGALQGALLVSQFNGNVIVLNLNDAGTGLEPLIDPGADGLLGTGDDFILDGDGVYPLITGLSTPLDVITGPDGTVWVAEIGGDFIKVFAPSNSTSIDLDTDDDGIANVNDPFIRDAANGGAATLLPNQTLVWDFDPNQDGNLVGPNGYGGGLTGVMVNGTTDFEQFFNSASTLPGQDIKLDNVKFITAAGGGTTVVESVSNGDPFAGGNNGEYLFHTGVTIAPTVDSFTVQWTVINPAGDLSGPFQQIGGYIGTGDQSNYLKLVAVQGLEGEIQLLLENNDVVQTSYFLQADDLFTVPPDQSIVLALTVNRSAGTAAPTITYGTGGGTSKTVSGPPIDLSGTAVLEAILGNYQVQGQTMGLAVGLLSSNTGQSAANTFQATFTDLVITGTAAAPQVKGTPYVGDLSGDGNADIFWFNQATQQTSWWQMDGNTIVQAQSISQLPEAGWNPHVGDLNGDGQDDIFWFNKATQQTSWWQMNGGTITTAEFITQIPEAGWNPHVGDLNGDGQDDIFWFNKATQQTSWWQMNGGTVVTAQYISQLPEAGWNPHVGDLNGDGQDDIFWFNKATQQTSWWQMNGGTIATAEFITQIPEAGWNPHVGDLNGDGQDDIFWFNELTGRTGLWEMAGGAILQATSNISQPVPAGWQPSIGDINADGNADIVWHNMITDEVGLWEMAGRQILQATLFSASGTTTVVPGPAPAPPTTPPTSVLYRLNAGGLEVTAIDGGPNWLIGTDFLLNPGSDNVVWGTNVVTLGPTVPTSTPAAIFETERWDAAGGDAMQYGFAVNPGNYEVRLYMGDGFDLTNGPGQRLFDVAIEGNVLGNLDDIDLVARFGSKVGGMISNTVAVTDGTLNIEFIHGLANNPSINGIEILQA